MIVFLDIDGVLNQLQGNYHLDKKCVERLGRVCKEIKGIIVLTSSWRLGYTNVGKCTPQIEELRKVFGEYNISILGRTADLGNRVKEIQDYITKYKVDKYIVIDDDKDEFIGNDTLEDIYYTDGKRGLTEKDVTQLIKEYGK